MPGGGRRRRSRTTSPYDSQSSSSDEYIGNDERGNGRQLRFQSKREPLDHSTVIALSRIEGLEDLLGSNNVRSKGSGTRSTSNSGLNSGQTSPTKSTLAKRDPFVDLDTIQPLSASTQLIALNNELTDFVKANMLNKEEIQARDKMIHTIIELMKTHWPDIDYIVFGSYGTGLAYSEADIDISIVIKKTRGKPTSAIIEKMEKMMSKEPSVYGALKSITGARVPIVKGIFLPCGIHFDISTSTEKDTLDSGIRYIRRLKERYPLLHPLSIIIKQLLRLRNLDQPFTGGMGGYCVVILVAAFLKSREMRCPYVHRDILKCRKAANTELAVALLEFLELYGSTFNYKDVTIDVRNRTVFVPKTRMICQTSDGLSVIDPTSPTDDMKDIGGAYFKWETIRDVFAWVGMALTLPYKKLMSIASCNLDPGNTMIERVMTTETLAPRIKQLCTAYVEGKSYLELDQPKVEETSVNKSAQSSPNNGIDKPTEVIPQLPTSASSSENPRKASVGFITNKDVSNYMNRNDNENPKDSSINVIEIEDDHVNNKVAIDNNIYSNNHDNDHDSESDNFIYDSNKETQPNSVEDVSNYEFSDYFLLDESNHGTSSISDV